MSTFEVDRQTLSGPGRVNGHSGGQGGQEQKDDGLFGALMDGLGGGDVQREGGRGTSETAGLFGSRGGQEQGEGSAAADGGRSLFRREYLATLFKGDGASAEGDTVRLSAEAAQVETAALTQDEAAADARSTRQRPGAKGAHGAHQAVLDGTTSTRTHASVSADHPAEVDGEDAADARAALGADAARMAADFAVPALIQPPAAEDAGEAAEEAPGGQQAAAEDALAGLQGDGVEGEDPASAIRITVLSRETHFAPAKLGGAAGSQAPAFSLPGEDPSAAGTDAEEGTRKREAQDGPRGSSIDRATARMAQERSEARLAARQEQAAGVAETEPAGAEPVQADAAGESSLTGTGGFQQGLTQSNLRQVSGAIGAELARMANPATTGQDAPRTAGGPLRLLDIQLHPSDLGTVTVRMRMGDSGLEVRLSAENPDTARMLRNDHAKLAEMLAAEGVEEARVSVVDAGDQSAWTRFETLPRTVLSFANEQGDGGGGSEEQAEGENERKGHDERETPSGGDRSARDER
ncbi:flagellar hook-length control protein FliK [Aquabacter cavernae]|uniref:flagellar hook-length control protein FliK n=1 Tax=Aquabacter cavernae TaxID=2496029 RepID=UPI000F8E7A41|nr:flagellar hook-length control protein FliK [Aquabacter cavernae]